VKLLLLLALALTVGACQRPSRFQAADIQSISEGAVKANGRLGHDIR
jgi:hypothetical protein